jgi:predicted membrane-bound dolichyl-phosphate-mannose-protein mannosyltransferase
MEIYPFNDAFVAAWTRWDAAHYVLIAENGYLSPTETASRLQFVSRFPPLFPFATAFIRFVTPLSTAASGILLSMTFLFLSSVLVFRICLTHFKSTESSYWSVLFLNVFPTSYFASAPYSEAMFLFLLALYFFLVLESRSIVGPSLVFAALNLTRSIGLVLFPVHLYLFLQAKRKDLRAWSGLLLPGLVFLGHLTFIHLWLGMPGYLEATDPFSVQVLSRWPFSETAGAISYFIDHPGLVRTPDFMYGVGYNALFIVLGTGLTVYGLKKLDRMLNIFSAAYLLFLSTVGVMISGPRFLFVHLPLFLILAQIPARWLKAAIAFCSLVALLVFSSRFVSGSWTF